MRISDWSSDVCSSDLAAGSADLEEGDPGDQPRAQQLAGADRLAGALRRGAAAPRPARAPADRAGDHRGTRAPPGGFHPRLRALRQAAVAAAAAGGVAAVNRKSTRLNSSH